MSLLSMNIAWWGKHFGEEPPLVGSSEQGAGAIFFSGCNLRCCFCQNYQISHNSRAGEELTPEQLADKMLFLQAQHAINIDLVSPTLWWKPLREALLMARDKGLKIPVVWNSNALEEVSMLKQFEGLVDIYLPDFKYADDSLAKKYSGISHYTIKAQKAIDEMLYQVGKLKIDEALAYRGVIVRHLVLPSHVQNSISVLTYLFNRNIRPFVSLMSQFNPLFQTCNFPEINRKLKIEEWNLVKAVYEQFGFQGWIQDLLSSDVYNPDFERERPFQNDK
jgi:putative pyruvate formate lyase activating enzyme